MKKTINAAIAFFALAALATGCGFLDVNPTDAIQGDALFSTEEGVQAYLANLYHRMPVEDFAFMPTAGFNYNEGTPNNNGAFEWVCTDDGLGSQHDHIVNYYDYSNYWTDGYKLNNDVNKFFTAIGELKSVDDDAKEILYGEAWFIRAYIYFALARRYGGVPIIEKVGSLDDESSLYIDRSTEVDTWKYVLKCCDEAAARLGEGNGLARRASRYAALALKSKAALHAASVGKFWDKSPMSGEAVTKKLVGGFSGVDVDFFYEECISACEEIISSGVFSLYKPSPANAKEASANYQAIFEDPNTALCECILLKGFNKVGSGFGSNQDCWGNPAQTAGSWPHPGRFGPTIDFVDNYECYSDPGKSAPIATYEGDTFDYNGYQSSRSYYEYDSPLEIFADKDARLSATVILPGSSWKNTDIIIQAGMIKPDGKAVIEPSANESVTINKVVYYAYGASGPAFYSGFDTYGGNMTRTGFGFKKFLSQTFVPVTPMNYSTTDWISLRYAEVLLNYAEAVVESGFGDEALAKECLNATRRRAAHTVDIPLTEENVYRERRAELAYEHTRAWDLIRRRDFHLVFSNTNRGALAPIYDIKNNKYLFVRKVARDTNPHTFDERGYYHEIPGTSENHLIQNPQY